MIMKLILSFFLHSNAWAVSSTIPYSFIPKEEIPLSQIGQPDSYIGLIKLSDSTTYELYEMPHSKSLKATPTLCQSTIKNLIGNKKNVKIKIEQGHTGPVCFFEYFSPIKKQTPAYRVGIMGFIQTRPVVITTDFEVLPNDDQKQATLKFWRTLR